MGILIDASVLVDAERGRLDVADRVAGRPDEPFCLSVVTVSELLNGVHRAADAGRKAKRTIFVETIIDRFPLLPIDLPTARVHAELWAGMAAAGTTIGAHDLWLAATGVAHDLVVATTNLRDFARVPGLVVEDWSASRPAAP